MRRLTDAFAVIIALAGFAVSYATQADLAGQHGFSVWEAWLWPGIADAAALAMVLRLHLGQVRRGWYTVEAWTVFALASAVAVAANAVADRTDPLGGAMHGVVPVVVLLVAHVIVHGRPGETVLVALDETADETADETVRRTRGETRRRRVTGDTRRRLNRLLRSHPDVTAAEVARRLGVSRGHAHRLLTEARRPRVLAEEEVR
ncbi:MAG TPA: DUF2637 domain-containing protein [Gemmataceae bacterium]|nr:DUF2637 domain-containing protein [Gemmataceae bacterium]